MATTPTPLYREAPERRLAAAYRLLGQRVTVTAARIRGAGDDPNNLVELTGELVSVALAPNGNTSDLVTIRVDPTLYDRAVSLAVVVSIEPAS